MSGDFEHFFRTSYPRLMARAVLLCGNRADAEDAVAEAFAEVARNWTTASGYDAPEAYLHVTMTRKVFRQFRWRRRQEEVAALELPVSPHATPHEAFAAKEVLAVIAGLPEMQRAVVVHCCLDGMAQAEVAKLLHIQRGTVAVHLHKARKTLSAALFDQAYDFVPDTATLTHRLLDAERWLAGGFAADGATRDRVRAAVNQVAQPKRRWGRG
ncbi:MAG TPA: sigma-70 family RNA polymerase sigma factor [Kutzneria sp.]|jgi:RNA polymerase sigma-70 factor (ECF subfamily)